MLNNDKKTLNCIRLRNLFLLPNLHTNKNIFTGEFVQDAKHCNKTDILKQVPWIPAFLVCVSSIKTNGTYMSLKR